VNIVVTVKLVPNPNAEKRIDPQNNRLVRTGVETVLNPYDEYALEAALQLKERMGGDTTVTIFSMAPDSLKEGLRRALAMGADDAVVLSDAGLEGSDVWATAAAMAAALRTLRFDLLIVGPLPALLTTALTFAEPRYASLKGIMGAKKKNIATKTLADLSLDVPVGAGGSKTELRSFAPPPVRGKGKTIEAADGAAGARAIFDFLAEKRLV
jgi:electron transfer flavoprotein beta subunit